jgi:hypothetical protein
MAAGDITLAAPKTITVNALVFVQAVLGPNAMEVVFQETATGQFHRVQVTDASCVGFDFTAGVFTDSVARAVAGELTKAYGLILKTNALRVLTQTLQSDGIITVAGVVG